MTGIIALITTPISERDSEARILLGDFGRVARDCGGIATVVHAGAGAAVVRAEFPSSDTMPDVFMMFSNRAHKQAQRPGEVDTYCVTLFDYSSGMALPACRA